MKELDDYFEAQTKVYEFFEVEKDWRLYPLDDCRHYFWRITDHNICYSEQKEDFSCKFGPRYSANIIGVTPNNLRVYRKKDYSLVIVDCERETSMAIFDNSKEIKDYEQ